MSQIKEISWENTPFDAVYCIHCVDEKYKCREEPLLKELDRVGLLNFRRFSFYNVVPTPFDAALYYTNPRLMSDDRRYFNADNISCGLAHYRLIKEALLVGHQRILILEDDVVFHKDLGRIQEIFDAMPEMDIILFDKIMGSDEQWFMASTNYRINKEYCYFVSAWLCSCYSLSKIGMRHIVNHQEMILHQPDYYTSEVKETINEQFKPSRAVSIENVCCQRAFPRTSKPAYVYENTCDCDVDFRNYNF